jgi:putative peptidoglycan lipid II flippase
MSNDSEILNKGSQAEQRVGQSPVVHAALMAVGTLTSRILGLARDMAFAALFSRTVTDAWTTAFRLPNLFRRLLGEGSLSVSFIPIFVDTWVFHPDVEGQPSAEVKNLINSFYTVLLVILSVLTVVGIIWAEPLLRLLLDQNYESIPGKLELTVRMARIMFGFIFLMSTYAYFMGILNALGKFALAAVAPALFNIAMIISTFVPTKYLPSEGDGLAWGVILGGFLQVGILVPALKKMGFMPEVQKSFSLAMANIKVKKIFKNMLPGMLGMGLLQITTIVNLRFASSLSEGAISYIYWADRLLELPLSLVSVSLGTALLPALAKLWSQKEVSKMAETSNYYLRLNMFIAVPAAIGLLSLAQPIVEVLFMRGRFNLVDAQNTAAVVKIYAIQLIASSAVRVFVPSFYAIKNTWLPALIASLSLVVHILIAPHLMSAFGLVGLSSTALISAALNFIGLAIAYNWILGSFGWLKVLKSMALFSIAGLGLFAAVQVYWPIYEFFGENIWGKLIALIVAVGLGAGVYGVIAWMMGLEEMKTTSATFIDKIRRRFNRKKTQ